MLAANTIWPDAPLMLVLSRKEGEAILIGDDVKIIVTRIECDHVRLRIDAPRDIPIYREELYLKIKSAPEGTPPEA